MDFSPILDIGLTLAIFGFPPAMLLLWLIHLQGENDE